MKIGDFPTKKKETLHSRVKKAVNPTRAERRECSRVGSEKKTRPEQKEEKRSRGGREKNPRL